MRKTSISNGANKLGFLLLAAFLMTTISPTVSVADAPARKYAATDEGIFRVDASGKRSRVAVPPKGQIFVDSIFSVSPNGNWALIDCLPRRAGPGRVSEIKTLVSLQNGSVLDPEQFKRRYGVWLDALAEWKASEPATIVMDDGASIAIR